MTTSTQPTKSLEVHEHCFISGPRARWAFPDPSRKLVHSHDGGDVPHKHADTGPGAYTIDKDEWFRETGLRGGGRKKFTKRPTGEQFPIAELEEWQKSFEIVYGPPPKGAQFENAHGPGIALPLRLIKTFGMTVSAIRDEA